jgi:3-oxoacyl-[acyl-carrier protein] reductase
MYCLRIQSVIRNWLARKASLPYAPLMAETPDFADKVVLVTGSSRGIGAGIITAFGTRGARCVVNYIDDPEGRNKGDAGDVAAGLSDARLVACDVSDDAQVLSMMEFITKELGGLDILVNNAGILRDRTIRKMSSEEWESVLGVNLTGAFHCIRHAIPILRDGGRVVNIASVSGQLGLFGQANYAASKAGLMALTKTAARELAKRAITVNAVAPGFIDTEMSRSMPEQVTKQFCSQIPLGQFGEIADVANAVLFLSSSDARYMTGQILHVNGGFYM